MLLQLVYNSLVSLCTNCNEFFVGSLLVLSILKRNSEFWLYAGEYVVYKEMK